MSCAERIVRLPDQCPWKYVENNANLNLKGRGENSMALKRGRIEDGVDTGRASSARYG
ncbi:hypothetical protein [Desulfosporosinus sp.]|uniref:hypothetical protein n=1 Tax=Desulfosporosinus sp. TaxID=157907 RepID=UPI002324F8E2|nr:hypothetical protein [Desulfosporosinus sp.]MCO5384588.1 hypothetical protein [Desulfosporosinus sp.]MDA8220236.1 hypothetical protein [Desulfitobacterium hafniense]